MRSVLYLRKSCKFALRKIDYKNSQKFSIQKEFGGKRKHEQ